jgi:ion channel
MASAVPASRSRGHAGSRLLAFRRGYHRHRFAWLFASLLLTLAAGGTIDEIAPHHNVFVWLLALNLLAAIASVAQDRDMRVPLSLGVAFVVTRVLLAALGVPGMLAVSDGIWVTAVVLAMVTCVRHALRPGIVNTERILAALDAYLLAGLLFGVVYWMLDQLWPGSFGGTGSPDKSLDHHRAIYFSFVTIATLGYGDVVPASETARGLAILEGVSGQLYLTVLVARLVSLYSQQRDD